METITIAAEKLFGFDKAKLQDLSAGILDGVVAKLKANPDIELVLVTGHTDRLGSDKYNQKLSERRANEVKNYLVSQGVDASRLQAVGKGESEPVVACDGVKGTKALKECLQPNRRVVLSAEKQRETGCK
jgi:OOP family OmpA-OmpF porin